VWLGEFRPVLGSIIVTSPQSVFDVCRNISRPDEFGIGDLNE